MTELRTVEQPCNIKVNDSGTKIQFYAYDENGRISFTSNDTLTFKIKNSIGYVKEVQGNSTGGGYIAELDSSDLTVLTPDTYFVELWVNKDGSTTIYPDKAFCPVAITQNVMSIAGDVLPTTSLADFESSLKAYVEQQTSTATTNIKSDFQKYVDSISNNTVATATKASQDATNAVKTANGASSKAQQAVTTANSMSDKIIANTSLITALNTALEKWNSTANLPMPCDFDKLPPGIYSCNGWGDLSGVKNKPSFLNSKWSTVLVFQNGYSQHQFVFEEHGAIHYRTIKVSDGSTLLDWELLGGN